MFHDVLTGWLTRTESRRQFERSRRNYSDYELVPVQGEKSTVCGCIWWLFFGCQRYKVASRSETRIYSPGFPFWCCWESCCGFCYCNFWLQMYLLCTNICCWYK